MGAAYTEQLDRLESTVQRTASEPFDELREILEAVAARQALFIGAGGALAVAQLAADLHERRAGMLARAVTPLEFVARPPTPLTSAVLFSASAKHPDARAAMAMLDGGPYDPTAIITHRPANADAALTEGSITRVVEISNELNGDGFLATNSVMAMATALIRAHLPGEALLVDVGRLPEEPPTDRRDWIVLTGPSLASAAVDFETRLAELGVGTVQVVDYRNFAHGRHFGLDRRRREVAVLALVAAPAEALAERTVELLPKEIPVVRLRSQAAWPLSVLELIAQSIRLAATISEVAGVDPARPGVPEFGRRLYHLRLNGLVPRTRSNPVDRKLAALGVAAGESALREQIDGRLKRWLARHADETLGGLVLDYDGTVCHTHERFELPRAQVRNELLRLLDSGLRVGFASGRGRSLHRDLREWVPEALWSRVVLGLYNGGLELSLADHLPDAGEIPNALKEAAARLHASVLREHIEVDTRPHQLTVRASVAIRDGGLATLVRETLERPPVLALKITASAHSVDVIPAESTKVRVLRSLEGRTAQSVLAIGDQGQLGGNDFELLAATESSLSVDRCSGDPTRCWNLGRSNHGPQLLVDYLQAISGPEPRFRWTRR